MISSFAVSQVKDKKNDWIERLGSSNFKINFKEIDSAKQKKNNFFFSGSFNVVYNSTNVLTFWLAGQENTSVFAMNGLANMNYRNNRKIWDTRAVLGYGITKSSNLDFSKKTNDIFNLNTSFALQLKKNFYVSIFSSLRTQFAEGYKYEKKNGKEIRTENSESLSPTNIRLGMGVLWKKSNNLKVTLSPLTGFAIFVNPKYTKKDGSYFGVPFGESQRLEFGANLEIFSMLNFLKKKVRITNITSLYSNYLKTPENIYINHNLIITITIKKFFAINYNLRALYDERTRSSFQIVQISGIGLNYKF